MPSNGRLPRRRRARRVVYKLVADLLDSFERGLVFTVDVSLEELARAAKLWKHPKSGHWIPDEERLDVDVDELRAALREVAGEMKAATRGRAGKSRTKGLAGDSGGRK